MKYTCCPRLPAASPNNLSPDGSAAVAASPLLSEGAAANAAKRVSSGIGPPTSPNLSCRGRLWGGLGSGAAALPALQIAANQRRNKGTAIQV